MNYPIMLNSRVLRITIIVTAMLILTVLLLMPHPSFYLRFSPQTKALIGKGYPVHFGIYCLVTGLIFSLWQSHSRRYSHREWMLIMILAHAFFTEVAQYWIPTRSSDPGDFLSNVMGIVCGYLFVSRYRQGREATTSSLS